MKPKDLKPPEKDLLFVPRERDWKRGSVEFCSGNGDWIVERASLEPERLFIAVEMRFDRVRKIWSKMRNRGIENLRVVCGEALRFCQLFVPDGGVEDVYINFPDPWPKRRHAPNRLMQKRFIDELARIMTGRLTFVTDDAPYMTQTVALLEAHEAFEGGPCQLEGYGGSYFETLWREQGREIFYATYDRRVAQDREDLQRLRTEISDSSAQESLC